MSSVISASYYLKIIKVIMFDEPNNATSNSYSYSNINSDINSNRDSNNSDSNSNINSNISPLHAFSIATCTAFITLFILDNELLINSIELAQFTI